MSRTRKGSKGPGYDYWSRRMGNESMCVSPSPYAKKTTHRKERRRDKRMAQQSGVIYR